MSASEIIQIVVAGTVIASFTVGLLVWLITPRLVATIEKTVNGKIDRLTVNVAEIGAESAARYALQSQHQAEMHSEIAVAAERYKHLLTELGHITKAVEANSARLLRIENQR